MFRTISAYLQLARPHQWLKNGFVLFGLIFGHAWGDTLVVQRVLCAFLAFCLASSAVYAFNDIRDRVADRGHPRKRLRPALLRPFAEHVEDIHHGRFAQPLTVIRPHATTLDRFAASP